MADGGPGGLGARLGQAGARHPTPAERRQGMLETSLQAVKRCQVRYGGQQELATEGSEEVIGLLSRLEAVLQHGMREASTPSLGLAVIRNVKDLVSQKDFAPADTGGIWRLARTVLNQQEQERYLVLDSLTTDTGRGRAWLRSVLNEQSLERHLLLLLGDESRLSQFYEEWAFMRDQERSSMLSPMAAGLTSIRFALKLDNPTLNKETGDSLLSPPFTSLSTFFPSSLKSQTKNSEPSIAAEVENTVVSTQPRMKKKKRQRAPAQIVCFDDSGEVEEASEELVLGCQEVGVGSQDRRGRTPAAAYSTPEEVQATLDILLGTRACLPGASAPRVSPPRASLCRTFLQETSPPRDSPKRASPPRASPLQNSPHRDYPVRASPTDASLPASPGEDFTFDYMDAQLDRVEGEKELTGGIYEEREEIEGPAKPRPAVIGALTPVTNLGVGALFPVATGTASVFDCGSVSGDEESSLPSLPPLPSPTPVPGDYAQQPRTLEQDSTGGRLFGGGSASIAGTLGQQDLRQALLSVIEKKDLLEEEVQGLRGLLDKEVVTSDQLRQEVQACRHTSRETMGKLEGRNTILARENELLKHQLKKYVGAVQTLRGGQAQETLARLEETGLEEGTTSKYIDYHFEAGEYEKKLIQVAEMHGELLEFNENLQRSVQSKDILLARMREELVALRGPLPQDGEGDSVSLSSCESRSLSSSSVLVHIWLPSVFLTGAGAARHHVYQVYVRLRDSEWNVYRRYSHFHQLHQGLRKKYPNVTSFNFPPKRSMGNMKESFVEDRRGALQSYLRSVVNYLVMTEASLSCQPDKSSLLALLPFLTDTVEPRSSNGPSLSIFSRRQRPDLQGSHAGPVL